MSVKILNFKASTNVKSLFGKDLVTDEITAVFELVKNSYDADATEVRIKISNSALENGSITIEDNGTGMDIQDIETKWMIIGTESKKDKEYSPIYQRPLNGDKGIGRFSVDRLGQKLTLKANKLNKNETIIANFDWVKFEDTFTNLDDVDIPYTSAHAELLKTGVALEIRELRDIWDEKKIIKLINSLRHFKSPFEGVSDNFSIIVEAPTYFEEEIEITPYKLEDMSNLWVKTQIKTDNLGKIMITAVRDGIEYKEEYESKYDFGPIYLEVYFFDTPGKIRFNSRMGMRVKDFGNIRLYRDDFRIHPYGEEWNDWLDLDRRKTQGTSRFFGTRDLIGFVQITKKRNKKIEVLTNRQGLIENEYYSQLKDFILDFSVKILEKYYFLRIKKESFQVAKKSIEDAVKELNRVAKELQKGSPATAKIIRQVTDVVQKSQSDQAKFVKNQEEVINVYQRVAQKEILLHKIIHEALLRLKNVKSESSSGKRKIRYFKKDIVESGINFSDVENFIENIQIHFEKIDQSTENAQDYLKGARDNLMRERNKVNVEMKKTMGSVLANYAETLLEKDIVCNIKAEKEVIYQVDIEDYKTIINNFISNAIKSLNKSKRENKQIIIEIVDKPQNVILIFKDNGIGIPENLRDRIFDPFFSTTEGFGIGLSIVDEIVKEYKGELNLAKNFISGAEFQIKLRK